MSGPSRLALVFLLAPLAVFLPLAVKAWQNEAFGWDAELSETVHDYSDRQSVLNRYVDVFGLVLHPAIQLLGALLLLVGVVILAARGRRRAALFLGLSAAGAVIGAPLLKELFESSPGAPPGGYSFPSGHALRTTTAAVAIATLAWPTGWRRATVVLGTISVLVIAFALVYHDWHPASDVIAGCCLGIAWVACVRLAVPPARGAGGYFSYAPTSGPPPRGRAAQSRSGENE